MEKSVAQNPDPISKMPNPKQLSLNLGLRWNWNAQRFWGHVLTVFYMTHQTTTAIIITAIFFASCEGFLSHSSINISQCRYCWTVCKSPIQTIKHKILDLIPARCVQCFKSVAQVLTDICKCPNSSQTIKYRYKFKSNQKKIP